jgi:hypothetical protein
MPPVVAIPQASTARDADHHAAPNGLRLAGWISGGLGVLGLGVGAVAGGVAIANKNSANCDGNLCANGGDIPSVKTAAAVADAAFVAGGVLLAGGVTLVLVGRPRGPDTAVTVTPAVGTTGGGITVGGSW